MTSYQKLKKRIAELEADRVRLLSDAKYYIEEHLRYAVYKDVIRSYWFGDPIPNEAVGELKEGFFASLLKDQDNNTNDQEGQSEVAPKG